MTKGNAFKNFLSLCLRSMLGLAVLAACLSFNSYAQDDEEFYPPVIEEDAAVEPAPAMDAKAPAPEEAEMPAFDDEAMVE